MIVDADALPLRGSATRVFEGDGHGARVSFMLAQVEPGEGPPLHRHPYEEVFVIHEGAARFTVGDATVDARAGQIVVAPAGVPHAFRNTGTVTLRSTNIHPVGSMTTDWLE